MFRADTSVLPITEQEGTNYAHNTNTTPIRLETPPNNRLLTRTRAKSWTIPVEDQPVNSAKWFVKLPSNVWRSPISFTKHSTKRGRTNYNITATYLSAAATIIEKAMAGPTPTRNLYIILALHHRDNMPMAFRRNNSKPNVSLPFRIVIRKPPHPPRKNKRERVLTEHDNYPDGLRTWTHQ